MYIIDTCDTVGNSARTVLLLRLFLPNIEAHLLAMLLQYLVLLFSLLRHVQVPCLPFMGCVYFMVQAP